MQVPGCLTTCCRSVNVEHVGVAAFFTEVLREGVAGPDRLEPWILVEAGLRHHRPRIDAGRLARDGFAAAEPGADLVHRPAIGVVLLREVLAPDRRILGVVGQLDDAEERVPGLLLVFEDVDEQRDHAERDQRRCDGGNDEPPGARPAASLFLRFSHVDCLSLRYSMCPTVE
jgi:hypothetical protein